MIAPVETTTCSTPRNRLKSSTGCWTCRDRKVKCDETKPECLNCTRRGRHCKGYDRILQWTNPSGSHSARPSPNSNAAATLDRRSRRYVGGPQTKLPLLAAIELNQAIAEADPAGFDGNGPFGAFQLLPESSKAGSSTIEMPQEINTVNNNTEEAVNPIFQPAQFDQSNGYLNHDPASFIPAPFLNPDMSEFATSDTTLCYPSLTDGLFVSSDSLDDISSHMDDVLIRDEIHFDAIIEQGPGGDRIGKLSPTDQLLRQIDDDVPLEYHFLNDNPGPVLMNALLTDFSMNDMSFKQCGVTQEMIYHYRTRVVHMMTPVVLPTRNPWLTMFLPRAAGPDGPSHGRDALLHTLISIAAFNRARLDSSETYENAGTFHMQQAIISLQQALQTHISTGKDKSEQINILATVLSMTTVEAFRGGQGVWSLHLEGARKFFESSGGYRVWLNYNSTSASLCQVYDCLDTLRATRGNWNVRMTSCEHHDGNRPGSQVADTTSRSAIQSEQPVCAEADTFDLDITYGISFPTLAGLKRVNELVMRLNCFGPSEPLHPHLRAEMEHISDSLHRFTQAVYPPPHGSFFEADIKFMCLKQLPQPVAQELMEHHCWAFHFSTILYFNRATVRHRQTTQRKQQWLVSQVFDHLEILNSLNDGDSHPITLWPALVAGCESSEPALRRRVISFFARNRHFGLGNLNVAKGVILEVWRRMDRCDRDDDTVLQDVASIPIGLVDWREVMHDLSADIVLA